jgi:hypothetical protein
VLADLAGFFEDVDVFFAERRVGMLGVVLVDELRQAKRASHSRRASADDDNVGFHLWAVDVLEGLPKDEIHRFIAEICLMKGRVGANLDTSERSAVNISQSISAARAQ